jgi:hypothetical protein
MFSVYTELSGKRRGPILPVTTSDSKKQSMCWLSLKGANPTAYVPGPGTASGLTCAVES